jgi:hypothetical protein
MSSGEAAVISIEKIKHKEADHQEIRPIGFGFAFPIKNIPAHQVIRPPNFGFDISNR